jgi:hypothetical protein
MLLRAMPKQEKLLEYMRTNVIVELVIFHLRRWKRLRDYF